jgi:hypothetical protein
LEEGRFGIEKAINLMTLAGPVDGPRNVSRRAKPFETAFFFYRISPKKSRSDFVESHYVATWEGGEPNEQTCL